MMCICMQYVGFGFLKTGTILFNLVLSAFSFFFSSGLAELLGEPRLGRPCLQQRLGSTDRLHLEEPTLAHASRLLESACGLPGCFVLHGHLHGA